MPASPNESFLDLPEGEDLSTEQLDAQVQRAQEQLLSLKRQQDLIEKQKRELEELSRRQSQLEEGKNEMVEKLTRAAVVLEREFLEAQKRVELLREIQEIFGHHYSMLESINPKNWAEGTDLNRELSRALSAVDDARAEYGKTYPKIQPDTPAAQWQEEELMEGSSDAHDFLYWLKSGAAFTLPLILLGLLALILLLVRY
jgi:DNA repair exonuclease SbcCD ATPase subunit